MVMRYTWIWVVVGICRGTRSGAGAGRWRGLPLVGAALHVPCHVVAPMSPAGPACTLRRRVQVSTLLPECLRALRHAPLALLEERHGPGPLVHLLWCLSKLPRGHRDAEPLLGPVLQQLKAGRRGGWQRGAGAADTLRLAFVPCCC